MESAQALLIGKHNCFSQDFSHALNYRREEGRNNQDNPTAPGSSWDSVQELWISHFGLVWVLFLWVFVCLFVFCMEMYVSGHAEGSSPKEGRWVLQFVSLLGHASGGLLWWIWDSSAWYAQKAWSLSLNLLLICQKTPLWWVWEGLQGHHLVCIRTKLVKLASFACILSDNST